MNDTIPATGIRPDVAEFVDAVGLELADLPSEVRDELLEDLPDHLADVLAEGGTPRERLGEPAAYAAELRAAAGYPTRRSPRWTGDLSHRLRTADVRIGAALGYDRLSDFAKSLRPAWWLVRAYLVVQLVTGALGRSGAGAITPLVGDNLLAGLVTLVAACAVSIWVGRRDTGRWGFAASVVVTLVLLFYSLVILDHATRSDTQYIDNSSGYVDPLSGVSNVFPVGPDGKQLSGIRLYDSDGNLISIPSTCPDAGSGVGDTAGTNPAAGTDPVTGEPVQTFPIVCPTDTSPFAPGQSPAPLPSAAATTTPAPTTSAPTAPAPTASPKASPTR